MPSCPSSRTVRRRARSSRSRPAFTLLEMLLAITILLLVFAIAFPLFRTQVRAMASQAGRYDAQQNVRFAISSIERELRVAGAGVPDRQPMIVQASPYAVTFNADLATRDTATEGDAFGAVYLDPDLPAGATMSMTPASQVTLPLSTRPWPSTTYTRGGPLSAAETISFWVAPDASPGSNGRYALYRRVNAMPVDTLARGLVLDPNTVPFTYQVLDSLGQPVDVAAASLPAYHVALHGTPADTGGSALVDRIRFVRIHLKATFLERDGSSTSRVVDASIRLLNAGLLNHATCGDPPVFGQSVTATYAAAPQPAVVLAWAPALDETAGEKDVERYVIYRRIATGPDFGEPLASIPAGQGAYQFSDTQITSGAQYVYAVAADDCGGQFSPLGTTNAITVP